VSPPIDELAAVLKLVTAALEGLSIPYAIGGSVASSVRGVMRATYDIDIVAQLDAGIASALAAALGSDWYADTEQIRSALVAGRPFNLIYIPTAHKIDVFPATTPFHMSEIQRATAAGFGPGVSAPVASPEDCLLAKLCWYRDGGEVSERQWLDISGIVATNPALDRRYLQDWAPQLGVTHLLGKALAAAP